MLHAGLVANLLNALTIEPDLRAHPMRYPGPLPGHDSEPPWGYTVGLEPLSPAAITTFMQIERPEWDPPAAADGSWVTIGQFYEELLAQLAKLPEPAFGGGRQLARSQNPGPGEMVEIIDLESARRAVETIVHQGEGHRPSGEPGRHPTLQEESDDDHEVAHYYQFEALSHYLTKGLIDPSRDVHPVIANPYAAEYSAAQQGANRAFNETYSQLIDGLQATLASDAPRAFGRPTALMVELGHRAAVLRNAGTVPGTDQLAGPTFEYLAPAGGGSA